MERTHEPEEQSKETTPETESSDTSLSDTTATPPPRPATAWTPFLTPLAIVIGFSLVAGALFLKDTGPQAATDTGNTANPPGAAVTMEDVVRAESPNLYGDPEAPITIVEFSDYECPFCARLHPTLKRIVDESDGSINWEYRHLPLRSHKNALTAAVIGECVAEHVGNDAFWTYTDTVFSDGPGEQNFYEATARSTGLDEATLASCLTDTDLQAIVQADLDQAQTLGAQGTPYNIIIFPDGTTRPVRGALPYESWVQALELN